MHIVRADDRGRGSHGWLESRHTFSFADYYNPSAMGFRSLRVINEDNVAPGRGFSTHPHRDMEILSYVISGALAHEDALGNRTTMHAGEVQLMSAGTGVTHSEFNGSESEPVHFLQIWILPKSKGLQPSYGEWKDPKRDTQGWSVIASENGVQPGSANINQDAVVSLGKCFASGDALPIARNKDRGMWLHVARGTFRIEGGDEVATLYAGDALVLDEKSATQLQLVAETAGEVLSFDVM